MGQTGDIPPGARTQGFLFCDLRGYTAFVEREGDRAAAGLLERYRELVRRAVASFSGAEIKTEGDSFYVVFPSASAAVRCGLEIIASASLTQAPETPIRVGVGVHAGETVQTAEGFVGSAVNIAARVCAAARPGELLVTDTVRSLIRTTLPVRFEPRGRPRLKGIAEPIALYRVVPASSGAREAAPAVRRWDTLPIAAVALLLVALAGGAVVGLALLASGSGTASPSPSTSGGELAISPPLPESVPPSPTAPVAAQTFPRSVSERDLLEQIPTAFRDRCRPSDGPLSDAAVSLACPLPLGEDADTVYYDSFAGKAVLTRQMQLTIGAHSLAEGGCEPQNPEGELEWDVGGFWSGQAACFSDAGGAWIWWTYDDELILARATRGETSWQPLFEWWTTYRILLRAGPAG